MLPVHYSFALFGKVFRFAQGNGGKTTKGGCMIFGVKTLKMYIKTCGREWKEGKWTNKCRKCEKRLWKSSENVIFVVSLQPENVSASAPSPWKRVGKGRIHFYIFQVKPRLAFLQVGVLLFLKWNHFMIPRWPWWPSGSYPVAESIVLSSML